MGIKVEVVWPVGVGPTTLHTLYRPRSIKAVEGTTDIRAVRAMYRGLQVGTRVEWQRVDLERKALRLAAETTTAAFRVLFLPQHPQPTTTVVTTLAAQLRVPMFPRDLTLLRSRQATVEVLEETMQALLLAVVP